MQKFKVTGRSGQTEVIEAHDHFDATKQFIDQHGEPSVSTEPYAGLKGTNSAYITEDDTYHD